MSRNVGLKAIASDVLSQRMIRVLGIGSILVIAQAIPAFAEKVTLACSLGPGYSVSYLTIDTIAKTVTDSSVKEHTGTYPAQITENDVVWEAPGITGHVYRSRYDRQRNGYCGWQTNGCNGSDITPCVRAAPRQF